MAPCEVGDNWNRATARRSKRRRGVLLLIVLSLLVLFLLVGLSFVVSASRFNRLAKYAAKTDTTGMPGRKLTNTALYQLLRGTTNPYSALQGHSLLEDLYGRDYLIGQTTGQAQASDFESRNQIQLIQVDFSNSNNYQLGAPLLEDGTDPQELRDDYFAGSVVTFLNGTARGISTRVLGYKPSQGKIMIKGVYVPGASPNMPRTLAGEPMRFLINGRPFNGTGAGYNPVTGALDNKVANTVPIAFLPNYKAFRELEALQQFVSGSLAFNYGGLDESWDSVDYQNLFLAKPADPGKLQNAEAAIAEMDSGASVSGEVRKLLDYYQRTGGTTPSFHRPYLLAYLKQNLSAPSFEQLRKAIVLRPTGSPDGDHPAFTGSNPRFDDVNGPWDVDNDGDGIPDSIWIDAGLSPVAAQDGRLYKPLVAAYVVDMDGRLNINAVDGLERMKARVATGFQSFTTTNGVVSVSGMPLGTSGQEKAFGLGFGPADVSLAASPNLLRSRYAGARRSNNTLRERYVELKPRDPPPDPWDEISTPGIGPAELTNDRRNPATTFSDDDFLHDTRPVVDDSNRNRWVRGWHAAPRMPDRFYRRSDQVSWIRGPQGSLETGFGSLADYHARSLPYLDATGNLVLAGRFLGQLDGLDDPYEINLLRPQTDDNPFDLSDLEAINRPDASREQSRAIKLLMDSGFTNFNNFTTHSFSIPAPPSINSDRYRGVMGPQPGDGLKRSLREMFTARILRARKRSTSDTPANPISDPRALQQIAFAQAGRIIAPEFERGEKLDINRVGVPNHPSHTELERQAILIQKESFARHLFNLLMLLSEDDLVLPSNTAPANSRRELHVRRIAQWAINVVEFGDADSVMTPFRYDVNPFNEFDPFVDMAGNVVHGGDPNNPDFRSIWGMEYPELLLTETLAFHDRRVKDTDSEENGETVENGDQDLDSTVKPEGSVFVELYCPRGPRLSTVAGAGFGGRWRHVASPAPEDVYLSDQLYIGRRLGAKPVWRLAISEVTTEKEMTAMKALESNPDQTTFEPADLGLELRRFIWFCSTGPDPGGEEEDATNTYFNRTFLDNSGNEIPQVVQPGRFRLQPGDYLLVGPRQMTAIGLRKGDASISNQRIKLAVGTAALVNSDAQHTRVDGTALRPPSSRVVPIIAQTSRGVGCSVSEPTDGSWYYPDPDLPSTGEAPARYNPVRGTPLDSEPPPDKDNSEQAPLWEDSETPTDEKAFLQATGTRKDVRTVFLQRLADPGRRWNPTSNPYRTIDWMPIDLTVFNSLDDGANDPDDPDPGPLEDFASREKTGVKPRGTPSHGTRIDEGLLNIWSAWSDLVPRVDMLDKDPGQADPSQTATLTSSANTNVPHSLGWLNRSFDAVGVVGDGLDHFRLTDDYYAEAPRGVIDTQTGLTTTFPSLVWNNRPYANPYEMMLVPATSSARFSAEYTISQSRSPIRDAGAPDAAYRGAFGHLLNFFHSSNGTNNETTSQIAGNYYRVFDFVAVPSLFHGTKTWLNTDTLQPNNPYYVSPAFIDRAIKTATIPEFREPGKVNLNTAPDSVWDRLGFDSLLQSSLTIKSIEFELSMAGYDYARVTTGGTLSLSTMVTGRYPNGQHPAEYPNPLRAGVGADLVARLPGMPVSPSVDATMLRSAFPPGADERQPVLGTYAIPNAAPGSTQQVASALQNRRTNAYFRFKDLMKLGNSVTSQSNVFAIWITVGYFEIEPNIGPEGTPFAVDAAHPDGYRYGIELGSDMGRVRRHRSFYIVDRSIPVAFEPGVDHNVDDAILLRRHLE